MAIFYRGPTADNYGYSPDRVTPGPVPLGSEEPWDELEALDWLEVGDLEHGDLVADLFLDADGVLRADRAEAVEGE